MTSTWRTVAIGYAGLCSNSWPEDRQVIPCPGSSVHRLRRTRFAYYIDRTVAAGSSRIGTSLAVTKVRTGERSRFISTGTNCSGKAAAVELKLDRSLLGR